MNSAAIFGCYDALQHSWSTAMLVVLAGLFYRQPSSATSRQSMCCDTQLVSVQETKERHFRSLAVVNFVPSLV